MYVTFNLLILKKQGFFENSLNFIGCRGNVKSEFFTIQNGCSTVKAFHRMNLNQNKCLNSHTASNMTAKLAKPIKNGRKLGRLRMIEFHFFWNANKNLRVAGKY